MKTVFVLFDSLNRLALESYGGGTVATPNFTRLAKRSVQFQKHYVGSLPCMPARRDMQTGRLSFLHRNWGPMEPFDNSLPALVGQNGGYSHLITDHYHYFHDGGATYHNRFNSYEFLRGQAADDWKAVIDPPASVFEDYHPAQVRPFTDHDRINRMYVKDEQDMTCPQIFNLATEFLDTNHKSDNWFLQVEAFDPHEPFIAPEHYKDPYRTDYDGPIFDWPMYGAVKEGPEEVAEVRANYAATLAMCDHYLGTLLDTFDRLNLWEDTALVVSTDHGFLLGEHDWWGKNLAPIYEELSHVPLFIHHPDHAQHAGTQRQSLTQVTDLMPTILSWHGIKIPREVTGHSLTPVLEHDTPQRDFAIFGYFGSAVNITDGDHVYMRYPDDLTAEGLYEYTLMPTGFGAMFEPIRLQTAVMAEPFEFTKNCAVLKVPAPARDDGKVTSMTGGQFSYEDPVTRLFDLANDPAQANPLEDPSIINKFEAGLKGELTLHDAPQEMFSRLNLF